MDKSLLVLALLILGYLFVLFRLDRIDPEDRDKMTMSMF